MKSLMLIVLFAISVQLQGQQLWKNYTSGNNVSDVLEHEGATYIATDGGLCVYDNPSALPQFFNRGNSNLPTNNIRFLEMADDGTLLMTTTKGLCAFDGTSVSLVYEHIQGPMTKNDAGIWVAGNDSLHLLNNGEKSSLAYATPYFLYTDILSDFEGNIWVTYYTFGAFGVARWDGFSWVNWDYSNSEFTFESPVSNQLAMDADGKVYSFNWGGLFEFNGETFVQSAPLPFETAWNLGGLEWIDNWMITGLTTTALNEDGQLIFYSFENGEWQTDNFWHTGYYTPKLIETSPNQFYVASTNNGCSYVDFDSFVFINPVNSGATAMDKNVVSSLAIAPNNQVYFVNGYYNNGGTLFTANDGEIAASNNPFLQEEEGVLAVDYDALGNLWVLANNIYKYNGETWESFSQADIGLQADFLHSDFVFANNGDVWLSQGVNILQYTNGNWVVHTNQDTGSPYNVQSLAINPVTQNLYAAYLIKVHYFDGTSWNAIDEPEITNTQGNNYIYDMDFDQAGDMWLMRRFSLIRYNETELEVFNETNSLMNQDFTARSIGIKGDQIWIGGVDKAILKAGDDWKMFDNTNSGIANNEIIDIDFDGLGNTWFAHQGGGISVYNPDGVGLGFKPLTVNKVKALNVYPNPVLSGQHFLVEIKDLEQINAKMILEVFNSKGDLLLQKEFNPYDNYCSFAIPQGFGAGQYTIIAKGGSEIYSGKVAIVE